ncbi:MAG TPA: response regulator [Candidatus Binataceae bacterium]|jgi:two-component system chemotaxis response regulator CheY|nr:response regulator [Candidatus Binataceae bacterium]
MAVRTLIVEDSIPARNIIRRRLEQMGCEVVGEAGNAAEGLRLFRSLSPQLITLDLMMPEVEGVHAKRLFSMIREQAPEVAVIVISAQPKSTGERAEYLRRGALAYFEKPFLKLESLADRLAQLFPELNK